ncbi:MAG: alpha/beta fold hydrolase [Oenococcus oeni]
MMYSNDEIGQITKQYVDITRKNRPLTTEIWYPIEEKEGKTFYSDLKVSQPHPLVLLSHGTGGNRFSLQWLARGLVQRGYIVAAPDHYGNSSSNPIPEYFVRYWERPLDISFVLTKILAEFPTAIDQANIFMAGFSFGGYTSLALMGANINFQLIKEKANTSEGKKEFTIPEMGDLTKMIPLIKENEIPSSLMDKRIKSFVAMAPALGMGFNSTTQVKNISTSVLIIGAEKDQIAPIKFNAENYHHLINNSEYYEISGAGHYIFLPYLEKFEEKDSVYFRDAKGVERKKIHIKVVEKIAGFYDKHIVKNV